MSLITRCPACQTLFKVVPDQLRISSGWVRCGICDEVFDAASHVHQDVTPLPEHATPQGETMSAVVPDPLPDIPISCIPEAIASSDRSAMAEVKAEAVTEVIVSVADNQFPNAGQVVEQNSADEVPASVEAVERPLEYEAATDEPVLTSDPVVSFMKGNGSQSVWQKTWARVALTSISIIFLLGLGIQVVVHERDRIAASMPQMRPMLAIICASLDCTISPLKQIESIVIESSAFTRVRGDVYRLTFAVKNTSSIELAMPALELTLTDAQDQAVMRRILTRVDLSASSNVLAPESDWAGAVSVSVRPVMGSGVDRIAGYRVLAFYP